MSESHARRTVQTILTSWPKGLSLVALVPLLREAPSLRPEYLLSAVFAIGGALAVWTLATPAGWRAASRWTEAHAALLLRGTVALYFLASFGGALATYAGFGMRYVIQIHDQAYWNTLAGKLLWVPTGDYGSLWAYHFSPIHLIFLPAYALFPTPVTLLFWQNVFLAASAAPLWLLLRRWLPALASLLLTWAFLLLPGVVAALRDFTVLAFAALPYIVTLLLYEEGRWRGFIISYALGCIAVTEYVALAFSSFGLLALLQRRTPRWIVFPVAISATSFAIATLLVIPHFRAQVPGLDSGNFNLIYYQHLGERALALGTGLLTDLPTTLALAATSPTATYLRDLLAPFLFVLPFAGPHLVLALPDLLKNVAADANTIRSIDSIYSITLSAALTAAAAAGLARVSQRFSWPARATAACSCLILVLSLTAPATLGGLLFVAYSWRMPHDALHEAVMTIPAGTSVAAPSRAISHLTRQWEIYYTDAPGTAALVANRVPEWVIHSEARPDWWIAWMDVDETALRMELREALRSGAYALFWERDGVRVYRSP